MLYNCNINQIINKNLIAIKNSGINSSINRVDKVFIV